MGRTEPTTDFMGSGGPGLMITNPLARAKAALPNAVRIEGDRLLWSRDQSGAAMDGGMVGFHEGESVEGAMWQFLELIEQPNEAFEAFAQRYGVLGIRSDGLPATAQLSGEVNPYPEYQNHHGVHWFAESISTWRMYAVALRTVLALATTVRDSPETSYTEVLQVFGLDRFSWESFDVPMSIPGEDTISRLYLRWLEFLSPARLAEFLDDAQGHDPRFVITSVVTNTWLKYASLVPVIDWREGQSYMALSLGSTGLGFYPTNMLFSVLAAQLAALLTSDGFERLDRCSACGRIFVPAIRPGRHARAYCDEHKLEGDRERKRRWARKVAAERKAKRGS